MRKDSTKMEGREDRDMLKSMRRKIVTTLCAVCLVSALWVFPVNAAEAFDPAFYAASYPDLAATLGTDSQVLLNHYLNYGMKEGRLPYRGAEPGAVVDGIAELPSAASEEAPAAGRFIDRVPEMLESHYQSYEMTRTKQWATAIPPKGAMIIEEKDEEERDYEGGTQAHKIYIYGNDLYDSLANYAPEHISVYTGTFLMTYEDISTKYGVSVPYMVYKFTQQDLQYVASYLDSPTVIRQELEWPRVHTLPGNIRYDAFARNRVYGYYKGVPVIIDLDDSFIAYPDNEPPYHYMPTVEISTNTDVDINVSIDHLLKDGYRRQ